MSAVLVVEKDVISRGMTILGREPDLIDASTWNEFLAEALK